MAIFRQGKRVGPFDIRIGLPRGKEYENMQKPDPEVFSPSATAINRFRSEISRGGGMSKPSKFLVRFTLPSIIETNPDIGKNISSLNASGRANEVASDVPRVAQEVRRNNISTQMAMGQNITLMCKNINLPERSFAASPFRNQYGPAVQYPTNVQYGQITASFYADKFLRQRTYFELWQNSIYDNVTNNFNYYDEYTTPIDIFQLGEFESKADTSHITYGIRAFEAYPVIVGPINYDYETQNQINIFQVTFNFRFWLNFAVEVSPSGTVGALTTGDIQEGGGPFSSLPPSLRTTARNAINSIKRSIPIGKVTGGKLFPPFT